MSSVLAALIGAAIAVLGVGSPATATFGPTNSDAETVTAGFLPTWQTNGTVWAMQAVGDVLYVGGNFTSVRPPGSAPGQNEVERARLAAFDVNTGDLLPWAPKATATPSTLPPGATPDPNCTSLPDQTWECATVWDLAVTPNGANLIVGGDFTKIDGKWRVGLAAFSTATGQVNQSFQPVSQGRVYSVAATNEAVYAGGPFAKFNGQERAGLASFDFPSGNLRSWAPTVTRGSSAVIKTVRDMALTQDGSRLIVGGGFDKLNDTTIHGLGAIDTSTGATARFDSQRIIKAAFVTSVNVYGDTVYSTADALGSVSEGIIAYDAMTGAEQWYDSCRGASHSMAISRGVVYVGSHAHDCGVMQDGFGENYQGYPSGDRRRYTLRAEVPGGNGDARLLDWFPQTNDGNGARAMAATDETLWVGGEFTYVDGTTHQQGLVRYSFADSGGRNRQPFKPTAPKVTSTRSGEVDIAWRQTEDPDHPELTYEIYRNGATGAPIHRVTSAGKPWLQEWLSFTDRGLEPGSTQTYDIRAIDPLGVKSSRSATVTVTVAGGEPSLNTLAKQDGAVLQYSFESLSGNKFTDGVSSRQATAGTGVSSVASGGATGKAISMSGSAGGAVVDGSRFYSTRAASVEALFKTNTTRGGTIASLGASSSTTGLSNPNTMNLYMDNQGRLSLGARPDGTRTSVWQDPFSSQRAVTSASSFNDGKWHHVVGTFQPGSGLEIWVDGQKVASDATINWSRAVNAYFRVGGDRTVGWPNAPTSSWLAGMIDEAAFYTYPLNAEQIGQHAQVMLAKLAAPTGVKAQATSADSVTVSWNAVPKATSYRVYRDGQLAGEVQQTEFTESGLEARTAYEYEVEAVSGTESSVWSAKAEVTTPAPAPVDLIASGSVWKYESSGIEPAGWNSATFDDSTWAAGPSKLGFGEGDEATLVPEIGADGKRRVTTYFRTAFEVPDAADVRELTMKARRDDGIVVYLNGVEVWRDNMPTGSISAETLSSTWAPDDGARWLSTTLPASALLEGRNTLAVEIHQNAKGSVDMSFDMGVTAQK